MIKYRVFQGLVLGFISICLWILIPAPNANAAATCANVRCASGTCIDTPAGPTCTQRLTCASTLCQAGSKCIETTTGPTCVPNTTRPTYGHSGGHYGNHYGQGHYGYGYSYTPPRRHYQGWRRHYRPRARNPYRHRGYGYRGYGYGYNHNPYGHGNYYTPRPPHTPKPPTVPDTKYCTKIYKPVCAQKQVQCFRAPCPPVQQTFGNACEANNAGYTVISNGVCNSYK